MPLADGLRLFIANELTDNLVPPKLKTGLSKSVLYHRRLLMWAAISELVSRRIGRSTRNATSDRHSACDRGRKAFRDVSYNEVLQRVAENGTGRKRNNCPVEDGEMNIGAVTNITVRNHQFDNAPMR